MIFILLPSDEIWLGRNNVEPKTIIKIFFLQSRRHSCLANYKTFYWETEVVKIKSLVLINVSFNAITTLHNKIKYFLLTGEEGGITCTH